jgi:SMC interacting uncharacterized protein involved in chromosome segregation
VATFTQEQVNSIVGSEKAKLNQKFSKFAEYEAAAKELKELKDAQKTDLEKMQSRAEAAEAELKELKSAQALAATRAKVAKEKGVPEELLTANTEEELTVQADALKKYIGSSNAPVVASDGFAPQIGGAKTAKDYFASALEGIL